jgi:undecaprenyl pyrophosphate phosphatase UppP
LISGLSKKNDRKIILSAGSAFAAVRWIVSYLRTRSLAVFGWYRIGIVVLVAALLLNGMLAA